MIDQENYLDRNAGITERARIIGSSIIKLFKHNEGGISGFVVQEIGRSPFHLSDGTSAEDAISLASERNEAMNKWNKSQRTFY